MKTIYITEQQSADLADKIIAESLVVNSSQVNDIRNYLNGSYVLSVNDDDIGLDGLPVTKTVITYVNKNHEPKMTVERDELLDIINDKYRHFVKDDASRLAYFDQILTDWMSGLIKPTGQLHVNVISDDSINKFKMRKQTKAKKDNTKTNKNK